MVARSLRCEGVSVVRPTPIIDPTRVRANIARMASRAHASGVRLRPHFKTHQSAEIGGWFREHGVSAITVSSVRMARYFADHGWRDITVAFPANLREVEEIATLARATTLGVLVDDPEVVRALARRVPEPLRVWVKIDTGLGRVGVRWGDLARLSAIGEALRSEERLAYAGALTHAGHSYAARSREDLAAIHSESVARLRAACDVLDEHAGHAGELSIGDTPTCSTVERFTGVDEIRPGNFVFYDLMQLGIGSCHEEDLAVAIACPVVGKYEQRGEIAIYGGAVHLSKEALADWRVPGRSLYGCLAIDPGAGLGRPEPRTPVVALSQEHGVVRVPPDLWDHLAVGDLVLVYPVHACLACDLHARYITTEGRTIERLTPGGVSAR